MRRVAGTKKLFFGVAALAAACMTAAAPAWALLGRAWVSAKGADEPDCGFGARPCRSLQYVHDKIIAPGGEIDVMDSAAYGPLKITKALTIVSEGAVAGLLADPGGIGVAIDAGASDVVVLEGLAIEGGGAAPTGVFAGRVGRLTIMDCVIRGFTAAGVRVSPAGAQDPAPQFSISGTRIIDNAGAGLQVTGAAAGVSGVLKDVNIANNAQGIEIDAGSLPAPQRLSLTVLGSRISNNSQYGISAKSGGTVSGLTVRDSTIADHPLALAFEGASMHVYIMHSTLRNCGAGIENAGGDVVIAGGGATPDCKMRP